MNKSLKSFRAPSSGLYEVSAQMIRYEPTGEFETVKNPYRMWFQFWKPKMITREIFKRIETPEAVRILHLYKGETVDSLFLRRV
jgi:hypothetical protein